jgi:hypothetical protein
LAGKLFLAVAILALAACESPPNQSPSISSTTGPAAVRVRDSVEYNCVASDPDGWPWYYDWQAEAGRFPWNWRDRAWWVAPDSSCRIRLWVTVSDDSGAADSETLQVRVLADTSAFAIWGGTVKHGEYAFWSDTVGTGYTVYGYLRADTANMTFYICDSLNFHEWRAGRQAEFLYQQLAHRATEFSARLEHAGVHFVVLDNRVGTVDADYELTALKRGP